MQFESNNKGSAMNCKKFIQLPTYCFDQAICNLLWLQNHELKSQKEQLKTKIGMKLHISISLSLKFMFSKKATKNYKVLNVDSTLTKLMSNCQ